MKFLASFRSRLFYLTVRFRKAFNAKTAILNSAGMVAQSAEIALLQIA
jgi:hypothetical protein